MTGASVRVDRAPAPRHVAGPTGDDAARPLHRKVRSLTSDIEDLERTRRWINLAVWGIALGVMVYGAINVTGLLIGHGVWIQVAWLLSVIVDLAMCVGLLGDRVLHRYGRRDGWVTALRWLTAVMTLVLNTTRPALAQDWVGVGIHTAGPTLLMLVAEGAGSFQRQLSEILMDLHAQLADLDNLIVHSGGPDPRSRTENTSDVPISRAVSSGLADSHSAAVEKETSLSPLSVAPPRPKPDLLGQSTKPAPAPVNGSLGFPLRCGHPETGCWSRGRGVPVGASIEVHGRVPA
jgi:hypothetical protein